MNRSKGPTDLWGPTACPRVRRVVSFARQGPQVLAAPSHAQGVVGANEAVEVKNGASIADGAVIPDGALVG